LLLIDYCGEAVVVAAFSPVQDSLGEAMRAGMFGKVDRQHDRELCANACSSR